MKAWAEMTLIGLSRRRRASVSVAWLACILFTASAAGTIMHVHRMTKAQGTWWCGNVIADPITLTLDYGVPILLAVVLVMGWLAWQRLVRVAHAVAHGGTCVVLAVGYWLYAMHVWRTYFGDVSLAQSVWWLP